jgi:hypothetical protein
MGAVVSQIISSGRCVALWFVAVLPLSPTVWRLCAMGPACFTSAWTGAGVEPATCLLDFAVSAPFAVIFGPLGHDEKAARSELPQVLITAACLAVLVTTLSLILRRLRAIHSEAIKRLARIKPD